MPLFAWLVAIPVLGALTGLRTMTPMAVLCCFAWRGNLGVGGTWAFWSGRGITVAIFAVLALGEIIGDKLPKTPNRTAPLPLLARIGFGGLVGALAATGLGGSAIEGAFLGAIGALAGAYLSFNIRRHLVKLRGYSDLLVALGEDIFVLGLSVLMMGIVTG